MSSKTKNKHSTVSTQGEGGAPMNLQRLERPQWSNCPLESKFCLRLLLLNTGPHRDNEQLFLSPLILEC